MSALQSLPRLHAARPFTQAAQVRTPAVRMQACRVVCMAHPRRMAKVAKQIEREIGQLLISDKVLLEAVCPERRRGFDGAVSALASVTEVQITNDLQVAKVYLSIYSDEMGKATAMAGLQRLEGYVRKHIGRQIRLRLTPEIRFVLDDSIEHTERVYKLLDQVAKIRSGLAEPPPIAIADGVYEEEEDEEDEWEEDDVLEGAVDLGFFDDEPKQQARKRFGEGRSGSSGPRGSTQASGTTQIVDEDDDGGFFDMSEDEFEVMVNQFKAQAEARGKRR